MPTFEVLGVVVDPLAIIVAGVAYEVLGFLWYGPLFGKKWSALTGKKMEPSKKRPLDMIFGFVVAMFLATGLNSILQFAQQVSELQPVMNVLISSGMIAGTTTFIVYAEEYLWEERDLKPLLINWGHQFANYIVMGAVLALFVL